MRPLPDFPPFAIAETVAIRIYERTGGQPYLLQLFGSLLISYLNREKRKTATVEDIGPVEEEVMSQGAHYFRHTYESAPQPARLILEQLAAGREPIMAATVEHWLIRRGLLTNERKLCIPALGAFMREELGLQFLQG